MSRTELICTSCNSSFNLLEYYHCPYCKGILEVRYDLDRVTASTGDAVKQELQPFPFSPGVFMGEGNASLIRAKCLEKKLGVARIDLKGEFMNPSGSFKDRPVAMGVKAGIHFGHKRLIVASSGNGAAAVSAFAAKAGMEAVVLVPESTPQEKVSQSMFLNANVIKIKGPYSNSFTLAKILAETESLFNVTTTFINPYTVEGDKGVAFELHDQLNGYWPDQIYVPIGAGPLLVGTRKGFMEMASLWEREYTPRMIGVQARGCSTVAEAYERKEDQVQEVVVPKTIAGGIGDGLQGYAKDGTHTLSHIRKSGGNAMAITDAGILEAQHELASLEGLFVEPSAAAALAGLKHNVELGKVRAEDHIVLLLTGHGLKDMASAEMKKDIPLVGEHDIKRIMKVIKGS
ncbi:threonine synthase [Salibacterium aidingense]|uniref:threonine synthase n=1 Tax=Salibacterium aidingense TaxID=384933 RepID=UPI0006874D6E|nr:threonine synthase [Salibacterium aidingense]